MGGRHDGGGGGMSHTAYVLARYVDGDAPGYPGIMICVSGR